MEWDVIAVLYAPTNTQSLLTRTKKGCHGRGMGVPERWHTVKLLQEWNGRKVLGRNVFGEAPGWAGQGCAPNHRAGQISAFDFFPVTIQAGLFLTSTHLLPGTMEVCEPHGELLFALWLGQLTPLQTRVLLALYASVVSTVAALLCLACASCVCGSVCVHTMYVYCVLVCTEPRGQYRLPSSTSLTLFLEPDLWVWGSLIWLDRLARMPWGST